MAHIAAGDPPGRHCSVPVCCAGIDPVTFRLTVDHNPLPFQLLVGARLISLTSLGILFIFSEARIIYFRAYAPAFTLSLTYTLMSECDASHTRAGLCMVDGSESYNR